MNTNITRTSTFVGLSADDQENRRRFAAKAYRLRNYGPEKVAAQVLRAVRENRAVVPITPEARIGRLMSRLSPAAHARFARVGTGPARRGSHPDAPGM